MVTIYLISFIGIAVIWALIAAATTIFYRNKSATNLSELEMKILYGSATILERITVFFLNLVSSIFAPPVYILAGIATLIFYLTS